MGGVRQQFSLEENIRLSLFAAEFLPNIKQHLGENVNLNLTSNGYLMLASEEGAECLLQNSKFQNQLGAQNITLTAKQLNAKFPWLNTDGISLGKYFFRCANCIPYHTHLMSTISGFRLFWCRKRGLVRSVCAINGFQTEGSVAGRPFC